MRFVYCAACICALLNDWRGMNMDATVQFINSSQNYDGAMGQAPGQEANGGGTYCAVATLALMNRLHDLENKERLLKWLVCNFFGSLFTGNYFYFSNLGIDILTFCLMGCRLIDKFQDFKEEQIK
jgi:hypothetical protein